MKLKRFFLPAEADVRLDDFDRLTLGEDLYNHIIKSMRMREGERLLLLDGRGFKGEASIENVDRDGSRVEVNIISVEEAGGEPESRVYLAQALAKKDKMETVWQKATEIGAAGFYPFTCRHTIVSLNDKKEKKRLNRWRRIIREAARQSERGLRPELNPLYEFPEIVELFGQFDLVLLARARQAGCSIRSLSEKNELEKASRILITVGPEGGFSDEEIAEMLEKDNCYDISLGPRILRTETAGPLLTGLTLHELGEME